MQANTEGLSQELPLDVVEEGAECPASGVHVSALTWELAAARSVMYRGRGPGRQKGRWPGHREDDADHTHSEPPHPAPRQGLLADTLLPAQHTSLSTHHHFTETEVWRTRRVTSQLICH